jgi:hypothetical protein
MLRDLIQGFAILQLLGAVLLFVLVPESWIFLVWAGVMAAAVFYERTLSRGEGAPRGAGWAPTAERFRDQESGAMVTVWFNAKTGERRYVEDGAAAQD